MSEPIKIISIGDNFRINNGKIEEYRGLTQNERDKRSPKWVQRYDKWAKWIALPNLLIGALILVGMSVNGVEKNGPNSLLGLTGLCLGYHAFHRDSRYTERSWRTPISEPTLKLSEETKATIQDLLAIEES